MRFQPMGLDGAYLIELEPVRDERGHFARTYATDDLRAQGIEMTITQAGSSFNPSRGTLRGLHYQRSPHGEAKLVRCVRGSLYDVAVDVRPHSPTYRRTVGIELRAGDLRQVYLPDGVAHGLLTLEDDTEVAYLMSGRYVADAATGVRWDDPAFDVEWPGEPAIISERDRTWPLYQG